MLIFQALKLSLIIIAQSFCHQKSIFPCKFRFETTLLACISLSVLSTLSRFHGNRSHLVWHSWDEYTNMLVYSSQGTETSQYDWNGQIADGHVFSTLQQNAISHDYQWQLHIIMLFCVLQALFLVYAATFLHKLSFFHFKFFTYNLSVFMLCKPHFAYCIFGYITGNKHFLMIFLTFFICFAWIHLL